MINEDFTASIREISSTSITGSRYRHQLKVLIDAEKEESITVDQMIKKLEELQHWGRGSWTITFIDYGEGLAAISPTEWIEGAPEA